MSSLRVLWLSWVAVSVLAACSPGRTGNEGGGDGGANDSSTTNPCSPNGPSKACSGPTEFTCNPDGTVASTVNCASNGQVCAPTLGCSVCVPNRGSCAGQTAQICNADGTGFATSEMCDPAMGQMCNGTSGRCESACEAAESSNSYIGCEYWPVVTSNASVADEFEFAVAITNPQTVPVLVTIERNGATLATTTVGPGALEAIRLPWVNELKQGGQTGSGIVRGGAYRLQSSLPVTAYQFNPLEYRIARDCASEAARNQVPNDSQCFAFSNDASLLLPTHVLTGNYIALARPTLLNEITIPGRPAQTGASPGFMTIVAVEEGTTTVNVTFAANVIAAPDGSVGAFNRGSTGSFDLNQGDVLQLISGVPASCNGPQETLPDGRTIRYCDVSPEFDLTGTEVRATAPVGMISGHNCDFVPYNRWACDHLEEAMFPLDTWGKDYIVSASEPLRGEPNVIRIVSGADNNALTFDPAGVAEPMTLSRGQVVEFEASSDFRVEGTEAFNVAQFLVGQDYGGFGASGEMATGDPAFALAIPTEQFRNEYTFLAPNTFIQSFVNVTAPNGASVTLDGNPVSGFRPVGNTGFQTARVMIPGGQHNIQSTQGFGIVVYGFGSYTSFFYPGGLDFEVINILQ
ncbi:MAG: IgGFc-binding protein [Myxococcota bacterium]